MEVLHELKYAWGDLWVGAFNFTYTYSPPFNPRGYWLMDEGSGSVIYDETENDNDGTISGASWVDGISGSGLDFDGSNDYVEVSSPNLFPTGNDVEP